MTRVESTPFMTSSPRKNKLPPPRHPLENRNSAPDIVVTGTTGKSLKILPIGQFFERFFFFYSHFNYSGVYNEHPISKLLNFFYFLYKKYYLIKKK